ncbi:hypothetical protein GCM10007094_22410 [Pseudovibrio japonicus]|uniref:Uncharacterized protein n=1 Tax=Pseudovibrio japonicus TaxID=366534 RepID=A0ABQ3EC16_9HYPH|nr:hypothetical protein GCM10007094_22410 [Pseudovibrio japonicus]
MAKVQKTLCMAHLAEKCQQCWCPLVRPRILPPQHSWRLGNLHGPAAKCVTSHSSPIQPATN